MKQMLGWVVIGVTALFVVMNLQRGSVWFLGIRVEMPIAFVVLASAFLGALATYIFTTLKGRT